MNERIKKTIWDMQHGKESLTIKVVGNSRRPPHKLTRRYIYQEDYDYVMQRAKERSFTAPNHKLNFAHYLHKILEDYKQGGQTCEQQ